MKEGNRFELLAAAPSTPQTPPITPPEAKPASKEFRVSNRLRRSRNSRGTKEAKRRRDARRSQRKLAAQILDDQLSRDIDMTLRKIDDLLPFSPGKEEKAQQERTPSPMTMATTVTPPPQPRLSPTPPQLPMLEFPSFDINAFRHLEVPTRCTPTPPIIAAPVPPLPSWCPALPSFTGNNVWSEGLPTFYDLSSLPEPKPKPKLEIEDKPTSKTVPRHKVAPKVRGLLPQSMCPCCNGEDELGLPKELNFWLNNQEYKLRVSRFFPPRPPTPMKPSVKLPSTACTLHASEKRLPAPNLDKSPNQCTLLKQSDALDKAIEAFKDPVESRGSSPEPEASAANLWRILDSQEKGKADEMTAADSYVASFTPRPDNHREIANWNSVIDQLKERQSAQTTREADVEDRYAAAYASESGEEAEKYLAAWQAAIAADDDDGMLPAELDGRELPYVHANALVGYANEIALSPYAEEHPDVKEDVDYTPLPCPPVGLNELLTDHDIDHAYSVAHSTASIRAPMPAYPTPSSVSHSIVLADILPVNCVAEQGDGETALQTSDAHYQSEQALFALPPLPATPAESVIDIATFLKMGHAPNCWCLDCGVDEQSDVPDLVSGDDRKPTDSDDDWVVYSPDRRTSPSTFSRSVTEVGSDGGEKDRRVRCSTESEWDDFLPVTPTSPGKLQGFGFAGGFDPEEWEVEF